jgi:adenylyl-sulfate kinase
MKGFTLWFTGLPSSGKSTLARRVEEILLERGMNVEVLDGDEVRENLSKGLGFSKEDRDINIRRIGFVAKLLSRNGTVAITAAISPYRDVRDEMRRAIGRFAEVYVQCPIDVLKERDVKGLYKKALAGEIKHFTGVDDPYEAPLKPEVLIESDRETEEQSVTKIITTLEALGYIPRVPGAEYSPAEEEAIKSRLKDLGYI